jgi:hypothetical protein
MGLDLVLDQTHYRPIKIEHRALSTRCFVYGFAKGPFKYHTKFASFLQSSYLWNLFTVA